MIRELKRPRSFYERLFRLTAPIALQNLITFSLGLIDTFMVSRLSNEAMAAVTTANVPVFLLISIVFGVQSGVGILISQYWGKKDMENISRAMGVAAYLGVGIALVLHGSCWWVAAAIQAESLIKVPLCAIRIRKGKWIHDVTLPEGEKR